jgi:serine/threonine protein kinase
MVRRGLIKAVEREISILKTIQHKHIISVTECFLRHDLICVVTEKADGGDLLSWILDGRLQHDDLYKRIFVQVLLAVQYLHGLGLAHNDIKAENVVLDADGNAKLIDFGFAKVGQVTGDSDKSGTLIYAAPEILLSGPYHPQQVDVWSLGILLYAMATRKFPYPTENDAVLRERICTGKLAFPKGMDENVKKLVRSMTKMNPNERPTVSQVLNSPFWNGGEISKKDGGVCHPCCANIRGNRDMDLIVW